MEIENGGQGYYQGMNYIVVFLYSIFKDKNITYRFMSFVFDRYLAETFNTELKGLHMLVYLCDKMIEHSNRKVWVKLQQNDVSSIIFMVPCLMTVLTSQIKSGEATQRTLEEAWDLFLVDGFKGLIRCISYYLSLQNNCILGVDPDLVLMAIKNIETHPLQCLLYDGKDPDEVSEIMKSISKQKVLEYGFSDEFYNLIIGQYKLIHYPIEKQWDRSFLL